MIPTDKGLGRLEHFDSRNWRLSTVMDYIPKRVNMLRKVARGLGIRDKRSWRQWMTYYQGNVGACTGFGSANKVAAAPVRPNMTQLRALDAMAWYHANQAEDRAHGRHYDEGATTLAAMEVGKRLGHWSGYYWSYNLNEVHTVVHDTDAVIFGTNWYDSMWDRDAEGIARITKNARLVGGHLYCINGYDPRRGLLRKVSSWNDGYYFLPDEAGARLLAEDGECVVTFETLPPIMARSEPGFTAEPGFGY